MKFIPLGFGSFIDTLQNVYIINYEKSFSESTQRDRSEESAKFSKWIEDFPSSYFYTGKQKTDEERKEDLISFCFKAKDRVITFYSRGILLALVLFLIGMTEQCGILPTILSDKKKFFLALILWPIYLFKYPTNKIREIIVEAELRRIGGIFRKLTFSERKLIREVAARKGFFRWIRTFHLENVHLFERSFVMAVAAVIIVNFVYAGESNADEIDLSRDGPSIQIEFSLEKVHCPNLELKTLDYAVNYEIFISEKIEDVIYQILVVGIITFTEKIFRPQEIMKKIDHVPVC